MTRTRTSGSSLGGCLGIFTAQFWFLMFLIETAIVGVIHFG